MRGGEGCQNPIAIAPGATGIPSYLWHRFTITVGFMFSQQEKLSSRGQRLWMK